MAMLNRVSPFGLPVCLAGVPAGPLCEMPGNVRYLDERKRASNSESF